MYAARAAPLQTGYEWLRDRHQIDVHIGFLRDLFSFTQNPLVPLKKEHLSIYGFPFLCCIFSKWMQGINIELFDMQVFFKLV